MWPAGVRGVGQERGRYDARMPRGTSPVAVACALTLLVSSCSLLEEEPEGPQHAPTAISPDEPVHCEEEGDCGDAGAVRWSLPLEGEHHVISGSSMEFGYATPVRDAAAGPSFSVGSAVHGDTLFLYQGDHVLAVDAATGEPVWEEEQVDPDQNKRAEALHVAGESLVLVAEDVRERHAYIYLGGTDREEGPGWTRVEHPDGEFSRFVTAGEEHVVLTGQQEGGEEDMVRHLVEADTGEISWSAELSGSPVPGAFTAQEMLVRERGEPGEEDDPDRLYTVDLADGQESGPVDLPTDPDWTEIAAAGTDTLALHRDCDVDGGVDDRCTDNVIGVDASDGQGLWEHPAPSTVLDAVEEEGRMVLLLEDREGHWWVDGADGEVLGSVGGGDARSPAGGVEVTETEPGRDEESDPDRPEWEVDVPGLGDPVVVDHAAGALPLTSHRYRGDGAVRTGDGGTVSVFRGCAPDGLGQESLDAPAAGKPCASPRLFAVDLG